jgi:membrane fusion protein (multidrug efflux system)
MIMRSAVRGLAAVALVAVGGAALVGLSGRMLPGSDQTGGEPVTPAVVGFGQFDVDSGVLDVHAVHPGRVTRVCVAEGTAVRKGDPLFQMDDRAAEQLLREAEAHLALTKARREDAGSATARHEALVAQQEAVIDARLHGLAAARTVVTRKGDLAGKQLLDTLEAQTAQEQLLQAEALLRAEREKLRELKLTRPANLVAAAEAEFLAAGARVEQARLNLEECVVRSPVDATVLRVRTAAGQWAGVRPELPALQLCPRQERVVRLEIQQQYAARVRVGDAATVEDDPPTGRTWPGTVLRLSDWITQRRSRSLDPFELNDVQTLETLIRLRPEPAGVRIGQRVLVRITPGVPAAP